MRKNARGNATAGHRTSVFADTVKKPSTPSRTNVLASLRATQIIASKPALPAELIALILDYLPPRELLRCARASRRLQEMVYDDTRWVQKLRAMGVWNESEARQRHEGSLRRKSETQKARETDETQRTGAHLNGSVNGIAGGGRERGTSFTIFDAATDGNTQSDALDRTTTRPKRTSIADGFDDLTLSPSTAGGLWSPSSLALALVVMRRVKSIRGRARQEYGTVHASLSPLYMDITKTNISTDALVFRLYREPEQQGQMLADLVRFSRSDSTQGWHDREQTLEGTLGTFEDAVLREFREAYELHDADRMRRHAKVLSTLDRGQVAIDTFIESHPVMLRSQRLGNPLDCLEGVAYGHVDLSPSHRFFEQLAIIITDQASLIEQVFLPSTQVLLPFVSRFSDVIVQEYVTVLFEEAHKKGKETYLKAVSGVFEQCKRCTISIQPGKASKDEFRRECNDILLRCFEPHIDLYLTEELEYFRTKSDEEVTIWERELSEQDAKAESFFMSNINRQAVKRDFLSSFKKVVMMPVNVLPAFPGSAVKPTAAAHLATESSSISSRSSTPTLGSGPFARVPAVQAEAPTTELAAKAAIMNSRLEGIKSLFSIEVALSLIHYAKSCIERCAIFARMSDQFSKQAKSQCEAIFISLLTVLGQRHIKVGFDTAVGHLSTYNPREVKDLRNGESADSTGVEPLVTFLELVNVGDLIQQMVDVFYVQELVATNLTDRDDFMNPAGKEKKRFEQMLDERVAAGMSKGIDVLIDEVEYVCATTQVATDFNPGADKSDPGGGGMVDIGPSTTAQQVVETISSHTGMLVGSTDKNMLDVFNQEVGLRLFGVLCKHVKRQRISVDGAIKLISDINHYSTFITTLRQRALIPYFTALRELSQIYLIDCNPHQQQQSPNLSKGNSANKKNNNNNNYAKELATIIADTDRYRGIFGVEEVYEFAERRADWYSVKRDVERAMYGIGCLVM